ncbi:hypothetical protein [Dongia sp.]|uniref:hypothetical protein n=1 Tax=Dongia sp. TaxID=1977262 RepID=UPI0035B3AD4C
MNTQYCENEATPQPTPPAWLADQTPQQQQLYASWQASSGTKPLPTLADLDLAELAGGFDGILLARAMPESSLHPYLFHPLAHHVTAGEKGAPGLEPTLFQHIPLAGCNVARTKRGPVADRVSHISADGMLVDYDVLYLPLAPDGGEVDALLILAVEMMPTDYLA